MAFARKIHVRDGAVPGFGSRTIGAARLSKIRPRDPTRRNRVLDVESLPFFHGPVLRMDGSVRYHLEW